VAEGIKLNVFQMHVRYVYGLGVAPDYEALFVFLDDIIDDSPEWFMLMAREFPNACWCADQFKRGQMDEVKKRGEDGNSVKF